MKLERIGETRVTRIPYDKEKIEHLTGQLTSLIKLYAESKDATKEEVMKAIQVINGALEVELKYSAVVFAEGEEHKGLIETLSTFMKR